MRRRMAFACAVLAMATVISGMSRHSAANGLQDLRPSMLDAVKDGVTITPLLTVGDVFGTAATGSRPSRTGSPCDPSAAGRSSST